jgi:hypothetical protein
VNKVNPNRIGLQTGYQPSTLNKQIMENVMIITQSNKVLALNLGLLKSNVTKMLHNLDYIFY